MAEMAVAETEKTLRKKRGNGFFQKRRGLIILKRCTCNFSLQTCRKTKTRKDHTKKILSLFIFNPDL